MAEFDYLQRFSFDGLPIRGQWVRLQQVVRDATAQQTAYPAPVLTSLAQQFAAVAMFADNLKFQGAVALQSRGEGALQRSLAECREQHKLRGIAHLNQTTSAAVGADNLRAWLGSGAQLALTLIYPEEANTEPYQGLIALSEPTLAANLETYFAQSEQLPTKLFFSDFDPNTETVTGLLIQKLPDPEGATEVDLEEYAEAWQTAQQLAATLSLEELATLTPERLLHRLFNEFPVRLHPPRTLHFECSCSRQKSDRTLRVVPEAELYELLDELGEINVDCEFCGARYRYDRVDLMALLKQSKQQSANDSDPTLH